VLAQLIGGTEDAALRPLADDLAALLHQLRLQRDDQYLTALLDAAKAMLIILDHSDKMGKSIFNIYSLNQLIPYVIKNYYLMF